MSDLTEADRRWDEHLVGCTQCNYHLGCRMCEGGYPDADDVPHMHACNCSKGRADNGYHLRIQTTWYKRRHRQQAIYEARREVIKGLAADVVMFAHGVAFNLTPQERQSMANEVANSIVRQDWS